MSEPRRTNTAMRGTSIVLALCFALLAQLLLPVLHSASCSGLKPVQTATGLAHEHEHAHEAPASVPAVSDRVEMHACGLCAALAQTQPPLLAPVVAQVASLAPSYEQVVVASTTLIGRTLLASSARAPPLS